MGVDNWVVALLVPAMLLAACGDDDEDVSAIPTATTVGPAASGLTTTPATTTTAPTATAVTDGAPSTAPVPTPSTTSCADPSASLDAVSVGYPQQMSGVVGHDIRTGAHACFERVVLEFAGPGDFPGYRVEYVDDPVRLSPSDQPVDIAGNATLVLSVAAWMTSAEGEGYHGPTDITPTNVEHVLELRLIENFEGLSAWAIGVDERRPFVVHELSDPPRLVIDIATAADAP